MGVCVYLSYRPQPSDFINNNNYVRSTQTRYVGIQFRFLILPISYAQILLLFIHAIFSRVFCIMYNNIYL